MNTSPQLPLMKGTTMGNNAWNNEFGKFVCRISSLFMFVNQDISMKTVFNAFFILEMKIFLADFGFTTVQWLDSYFPYNNNIIANILDIMCQNLSIETMRFRVFDSSLYPNYLYSQQWSIRPIPMNNTLWRKTKWKVGKLIDHWKKSIRLNVGCTFVFLFWLEWE